MKASVWGKMTVVELWTLAGSALGPLLLLTALRRSRRVQAAQHLVLLSAAEQLLLARSPGGHRRAS